MSDGKKFAPKNVASAEERLTEVERKYSVIQERIQAYDMVLEEFRALKAELKANRKIIEAFVSASGSVFDELRTKIDTYPAQFQILHAKTESISKAIEDQKNYVGKFASNNNKIINDFNEIVSKIKEQVATSLSENGKLNARLPQIEASLSNLNKSNLSTKTAVDKLTEDHIKCKDASEDFQSAIAKDIAKLKQTISNLPSLQEWANTLYARFQQDMGYRDKQATAYVDKKVSDLGKTFEENPLSAQGVKAALFNEIQALALDGKNAYLKSNNIASQLALLEKKLENLNLLFKKHQLNA
jgi:chromosome segregation ATPase